MLYTNTFDIVIGTNFLPCNPKVKLLSLQLPMPYTVILAVAFSVSPSSCHDVKNLVCAT